VVTAAALDGPELTADDPVAGALAITLPALRPDATLRSAAIALQDHDATGLPVVPAESTVPVGWLDHRDVLAACTREKLP
jgi:CBS domain-containing protein